MMYVQDYDETYPPALVATRPDVTPPISGLASMSVYDQIYPYVMNQQIFWCPSGNKGAIYSSDYGFNRNLCPDLRTSGSAVKMATVRAPAEIFMCLDSGAYMVNQTNVTSPTYSFWYVPGTWDQARDPDGTGYHSSGNLSGFAQTDYMHGRHNEGINIGFADGHAKWLSGQYVRGNLQHWTP